MEKNDGTTMKFYFDAPDLETAKRIHNDMQSSNRLHVPDNARCSKMFLKRHRYYDSVYGYGGFGGYGRVLVDRLEEESREAIQGGSIINVPKETSWIINYGNASGSGWRPYLEGKTIRKRS